MPKQFASFANDKLRVSTALPATDVFTVMFWVKWNSSSAVSRPCFYRYNNTGNPYLFFGLTSTSLIRVNWQRYGTTTHTGNVDGSALTAGTWYHLCIAVSNGGDTINCYQNGASVGADTTTGGTPSAANDTLLFGGSDDTDGESGLCTLCAIKVWDGIALNQDQVNAEMGTAQAVLRDQLYREWPGLVGLEPSDEQGKAWDTFAGTAAEYDYPPGVDFYPPARRLTPGAPAAAAVFGRGVYLNQAVMTATY